MPVIEVNGQKVRVEVLGELLDMVEVALNLYFSGGDAWDAMNTLDMAYQAALGRDIADAGQS